MHTLVYAVFSRYVPAAQDVDGTDVDGNSVHSPPGVPYQPILQVHCKAEELPIGDSEFIGQGIIISLEQYVFARHSVQTPSGTRYKHVLESVAPISLEYIPYAQDVHVD
jgi:hypothetical protein